MSRATVVRVSRDKRWWEKTREQASATAQLVIRNVPKLAEKYFTVKEVAERLNVGIWSIYDYIAEGSLGCQIVGRRKRISIEHLDNFLALQNLKKGPRRAVP